MKPSDHEPLMQRALELARRGWGDTHPNPLVGALIVEGGEIVGEGHHAKAGQAHAETQLRRRQQRLRHRRRAAQQHFRMERSTG